MGHNPSPAYPGFSDLSLCVSSAAPPILISNVNSLAGSMLGNPSSLWAQDLWPSPENRLPLAPPSFRKLEVLFLWHIHPEFVIHLWEEACYVCRVISWFVCVILSHGRCSSVLYWSVHPLEVRSLWQPKSGPPPPPPPLIISKSLSKLRVYMVCKVMV